MDVPLSVKSTGPVAVLSVPIFVTVILTGEFLGPNVVPFVQTQVPSEEPATTYRVDDKEGAT